MDISAIDNGEAQELTAVPTVPRTVRLDQRKALASGMHALSGLCHGFASITAIDPTTTAEEAASIERDLNQALKTLRDLTNKIKEHRNATR